MLIVKKIGCRKLQEIYTFISFNSVAHDTPIQYPTKKIEMYSLRRNYPIYEYSVHIDRRSARIDCIFKYTDSGDVYLFTI